MLKRTAPQAALCLILAGSITFVGLPAHAQQPAASADDVVNLKNGGLIRGKILEILPDESVTIESSATGERKTYPWAEVAGVERAGEANAVSASAGDAPVDAAPQAGPGRPFLHIESTRPADLQLFEITGETIATGYVGGNTATIRGIHYRSACVAPCDAIVDGSQGQPFFIGGEGVTTSRRFTLSGQSGDVVARVKPGRRGLRMGGLITMSLGLATAAAGGVLFIFAKPLGGGGVDNMGNPLPEPEPNYVPATAVLVSGLALVAGGIAMYVIGRTKVQLEPRGLALGRRVRLHAGAGLTARF